MEAVFDPATPALPLATGGARRRRPLRALAARIGGSLLVSVVTTTWSLSLLVVLTRSGALAAAAANVVATLSGVPWSYWLNRRFVWRRRGAHRLRGEVIPFVTMCVVALIASTAAVGFADHLAADANLSSWWRTAVVVAANVGSFGSMWVVQFLLLDRLLFVHRPPSDGRVSNGPKVHGGPSASVHTLNVGVGISPTRDVDPSFRAGDEESERGS